MDAAVTKLIQNIEQRWRQGIIPCPDTLFFLESTFGISGSEDFHQIFGQLDSSEQEMILEMILFPDHDLRMSIEPHLDMNGLSTAQEDAFSRNLHGKFPQLTVNHPAWADSIVLQISSDQIRLFTSRLKMKQPVDPLICRTLETSRSTPEMVQCRLFMRKSGMVVSDNKQQVLVKLIQNTAAHHPPFLKIFEIALDILSEAPEKGPLDRIFLSRRNQEKKMLDAIGDFEKKRERYSMEYLMSQRYPVPAKSYDETWERLQLLDVIISQILCIPLPFDPLPPRIEDLGRLDPKTDMSDIFKMLS